MGNAIFIVKHIHRYCAILCCETKLLLIYCYVKQLLEISLVHQKVMHSIDCMVCVRTKVLCSSVVLLSAHFHLKLLSAPKGSLEMLFFIAGYHIDVYLYNRACVHC